ncbi:MAG: glycosyl hydrolase family 28-related protein [Sulfurimonas sp.]|nr:glycosyl hydrolase family 28-related protein [Sulfurimonas sp.]
MNFKNTIKWLLVAIALVIITACSGGGDSTPFNPDTQIDDYNFTSKTDVALLSEIESDIVIVSGINVPVNISVSSGSYYRINSGTYTEDNGTIRNGNTVQVLHISSEYSNTSVSTILSINDVNGTFTSTTTLKDTRPDTFSFSDEENVMRYGLIESNETTISGINSPTPVSITAGSYYRINGGLYTDYNGTLTNGDTVQVRHVSSVDFNTSISTTLTIGGVDGVFTSTTLEENLTVVGLVNVRDNGATGDGITDDSNAIEVAYNLAKNEGKNLYFPVGTYRCNTFVNAQGVRFIGEDKNTTIIKDTLDRLSILHNIAGAENITFENYKVGDYATPKHRLFKNCIFRVNAPSDIDLSGYYMMTTGLSDTRRNVDDEFVDCNFIFDRVYISLYISQYNSVSIHNCSFDGNATHNIRLASAYNRNPRISIVGNTLDGGKTGIFIGSDRSFPIQGGLIEGNTLRNQYEEGISLDGFGNNPAKVPVIANGPIDSVSNDENGRVVIGMAQMVYMNSNKASSPSPVSLRDDWTNFYFSFGEGSGQEGTLVKIHSFNTADNTLTLDSFTLAPNINVGGDSGVQTGFFNWIVRDNNLSGILGTAFGSEYGTAISIYLNVFGTLVENNTVSNSAHGVNVAGSLLENVVRSLAYGNTVRNNTFLNCDTTRLGSTDYGVIRFNSRYGGPIQYNNKLINNTINNDANFNPARIFIQRQKSFTITDNNLINGEIEYDN